MTSPAEGIRLDKWLFHARLFKTRGQAADRIEAGGVRLNGQPCRKPGRAIRPGDRLTLSDRGQVRSLQILGLGTRRGPYAEARLLYLDLSDDVAPECP